MSDRVSLSPLNWVAYFQPFITGGIAGCTATSIVQPIDFIKVQLQLQGEGQRRTETKPLSGFQIISKAIRENGIKSIYAGYSAAIARQVVYGSSRLGFFRVFSNSLKSSETETLSIGKKIIAGLSAGFVASWIGNPCEVALIRMQSDSTLPIAQQRKYTGIFNAISRIIKEEGVLKLWTGSSSTITRAMSLNAAMLATADQVKEDVRPYVGEFQAVVISSVVAGVAASVASLPFDAIKTRLQKQVPNPTTGILPYKGFLDCAKQIAEKEGLSAFYKGLGTYIIRISPHAIITLVVLDFLNGYFTKYILK
jgi:solute carrier family 25 (mitochondrial oxoglutarate transporter), member 11